MRNDERWAGGEVIVAAVRDVPGAASEFEGVAMGAGDWVRRLVRPLASRKVRVALATVLAAYAAEHELAWSEDLVLTVVSVGVALILGIAHEDAGKAESGSGVRVSGSEERGANP